ANRITLVEGVEKVADFGRIPDKRALDFGNRDLPRLDPGKESLDGMRSERAAFGQGSAPVSARVSIFSADILGGSLLCAWNVGGIADLSLARRPSRRPFAAARRTESSWPVGLAL